MENNDFEKSFAKLKEISDKMKEPGISLEESIKRFDEGMKCYKKCEKILNEAKQTIEKITD